MLSDMNVYFFDVGKGLTKSWHSSGSAAVIASSQEEAMTKLPLGSNEISLAYTFPLEANFVPTEEQIVQIFPDAGCC